MGCLKLAPEDFLMTAKGVQGVMKVAGKGSVSIVEVYFDDFKVTQIKSPVIEEQFYYPFGSITHHLPKAGSYILAP